MTEHKDPTIGAHAIARERASSAPHRIGAGYVGRAFGGAGSDGWRGVVSISDGTDQHIDVLVAVAGKVPLGPSSVKPDIVCALVEEIAGDFPRGGSVAGVAGGDRRRRRRTTRAAAGRKVPRSVADGFRVATRLSDRQHGDPVGLHPVCGDLSLRATQRDLTRAHEVVKAVL
jgi:hypothetical protein